MINIQNKVDCCGCNACGDICSKNAISFKTDIEGFWYPEVNKELCVDCGLCEKVCPILNVNDLRKNDMPQSICYAAEHKNINVIFDSTSGGLFSALAEVMYKNKGYVGGAVYNKDFSVSHFISSDKTDLPRLRSSKYLQSNLEGFYREVKKLVIAGEQVLVCGAPCQMVALRAFLGKDYENLIIVDFICRGINSPKVWQKFLKSIEEKYGAHIIYIKSKSKEYGWRNLTTKIVLADGRHLYETKDQCSYTKGYLQTNAYCRPSCYGCKFKGFPRISDITLADFWGIEAVDKSMEKNLGTSLVMVNSQKGVSFFEKAKSKAKTIQVPFNSILPGNPALIKPLGPPLVNRTKFFEDLDKMSFSELANEYGINNIHENKKTILNRYIKNIRGFISFIRRGGALIRFFRYNKITSILKGIYFAPYKYTIIQKEKNASFTVNGVFSFGYKRIKGSHLESRMLIEDGASLDVTGNFNIYYGADIEVFKNAKLIIKGDGAANINFTCICAEKIEIGKDVRIGRNVTIRDNNGGHYINVIGYENTRPVKIGNKVWLCEQCTIMPGVEIGDGAIISAHSVVTSNVPPYSVVSGAPAQVIAKDVLWKY